MSSWTIIGLRVIVRLREVVQKMHEKFGPKNSACSTAQGANSQGRMMKFSCLLAGFSKEERPWKPQFTSMEHLLPHSPHTHTHPFTYSTIKAKSFFFFFWNYHARLFLIVTKITVLDQIQRRGGRFEYVTYRL